MKIRLKLFLGFLILAAMLAVAGAYSIYELQTLGASVQLILDENYRSIHAARTMIESLEREDSGVLLLLSGHWKEGRNTINQADKAFTEAFKTAEGNLTLPGEKEAVEQIRSRYEDFHRQWDRLIVGTSLEGDLQWYFSDVHNTFAEAKSAVQRLTDLNHGAMYDTASMLKNRARRALMPGIVAIVSALALTAVFSLFVNLFFVNPLLSIIRSIRKFRDTGEPFDTSVRTRDELFDLSVAVKELTAMASRP